MALKYFPHRQSSLRRYKLKGSRTFLKVVALAALASNSDAALQPTVDGKMIYDTTLNIYWLADANYLKRTDDPYGNPEGKMDWGLLNSKVSQMNSEAAGLGHLGFTDWRLPTNASCSGGSCIGSEMEHLFYVDLGGVRGHSILEDGSHNSNLALFQNVKSFGYWSGTNIGGTAWGFGFHNGDQFFTETYYNFFGMAVRPGPAPQVPEPGTIAMFLIGSAILAARLRFRSVSPD